MTNILYRVGVYDILENAQKVCTSWHTICKDPAMWRVIRLEKMLDDRITTYYRTRRLKPSMFKMCKHDVDRSQGQLLDISMEGLYDKKLLEYIADRSSQLRRLQLKYCASKNLAECLEKFPLLEELCLYKTYISTKTIETAGRCCPMLTTLEILYLLGSYLNDIGEELPKLKHLNLIGHAMSNRGLQAILDGCRHLELPDLRHCHSINLNGEIGKKCLESIKCVKSRIR